MIKKITNKFKNIIYKFQYRELIEIRSLFTKENQWGLSLDDAIKLDKIIKKYKIKKILELGTGIGMGTLGMSWSLPEDGRIDTVEQFDKCIDIAKKTIPQRYKDKINFYQSDAEVFEPFKYINTLAYKNLPPGDWDLIVIDGPSYFLENDYLVCSLPRGDIFRIMKIIKNGDYIYIDGSYITNKLLKRFYSHCLEYKNGLYKKIKNDAPQDAKKEALKNYGFLQ